MRRVLLVDDDSMARMALRDLLTASGFSITEATGGKEALELFQRDEFGVVLLDLRMPDMNGIRVMEKLKGLRPEVPVVIITGYGDVPTAVEAIQLGAYDFLLKPPEVDRLVATLERALEKMRLETELRRLNDAVAKSLESLLGKSEVMKKVIQQIRQVAQSDLSVVIQGETGTGKSFVARLIHSFSNRAEKPFIVVDMGAIPESLAESELLGYERGAFTGADRSRKGFFELANQGTLLIDDLENISSRVQSKLLGVVESRKMYPLGSPRQVKIDIRIIGATNTDIKQAVKERKFREDLFFRLNEFMIILPSLRERTADIEFLARTFLIDAGREMNKQTKEISEKAGRLLKRHSWPGNVRELKNVIRRALLFAQDGIIRPEHIQFLTWNEPENEQVLSSTKLKEIVGKVTEDAERKAIHLALTTTNGNRTKAALLLGIDYKTLLTKIKEYKILVRMQA